MTEAAQEQAVLTLTDGVEDGAKAAYVARRDRAVAALHALAGVTTLGEVLNYQAMDTASGVGRHDRIWKTVVARWKKAESASYGREYQSVPGLGYRLLTADGRIDKAHGIRKSANKRLHKALDLALTTDLSALSPDRASLRKHIMREVSAELAADISAVAEQQQELAQTAATLKDTEIENEQ